MASPPDRLRAHDGRARRMAKLAQFFEAQPEVLAHRVIGVVVEARVVPEAVDFGRHVALKAPEPAELGQMLVADAAGAERGGRTSRLNCGLVRERGTLLTSTTSLTAAALRSAANSAIGRVECTMVKNGLG